MLWLLHYLTLGDNMTREHYTPTPQPRPVADIALAVAIGICLALVLFFNL